ncbi:MAG: 2OG-Fe(II) oxygenase [Rudaea sp.]|nr:2OG-Fe(II) oxygenase [Rudaea sp.]
MQTEPPSGTSTLHLDRCIQVFDGAMTPEFCVQMVESFNSLERLQVPNGRGYKRGLEGSSWTELNITPLADAGFKGFFLAQIEEYLARYNQNLDLTIPVPNRPRIEDIRIKRYRAGADEKFEPHYDARDEKCNRYLVFLWYLNDVAEGGETEFCNFGLKVQARAGRLLMFPPYWMFQHAGLAPRSNDKYIVSTYLLF